ncbi:hypothetical protein [Rhizobium rhizogenes]|uniref:hypothetical protein n=1 Tax=Rhizobium rhizogenes TaxID=359 RepID=UPI0004D63699|nr:hypothetical protein [Rhizobium rhizogenes]KEA07501.1 hypothetical protein CN09_11400 [Rhizobium rhizogenes]NTJ22223.1 hypothetical protein [Rhizobium rhizogenes]QUE80942.1 hypothetical protein EML492_03785 [Rhizobium rhizogenes]TQO80952.1 hypothetical protein FFE80_07620 [Rhizobium rhizogenes]TRB51546.1 hypothetical protein EXN69_26505 [Rhizobium rhizogenes]
MSSSHYIIVARNNETGEIQLPLEDMTLYGMGVDTETGEYEEESVVRTCAMSYGPEWTLTLYGPLGSSYYGTKKP